MVKKNDCDIKPKSVWDVLFKSKKLRWSIGISMILAIIFIGAFFNILAKCGCDFEFGGSSIIKIYNCGKK